MEAVEGEARTSITPFVGIAVIQISFDMGLASYSERTSWK